MASAAEDTGPSSAEIERVDIRMSSVTVGKLVGKRKKFSQLTYADETGQVPSCIERDKEERDASYASMLVYVIVMAEDAQSKASSGQRCKQGERPSGNVLIRTVLLQQMVRIPCSAFTMADLSQPSRLRTNTLMPHTIPASTAPKARARRRTTNVDFLKDQFWRIHSAGHQYRIGSASIARHQEKAAHAHGRRT